jgi:signal transduction histidine kinase
MPTSNPSSRHLRTALLRSIVIPIAAMAVLAGVFYTQIRHLLEVSAYVDRSEQTISDAKTALGLIVDMESSVRGYLVAKDRSFLEPFLEAQKRVEAQMAKVKAGAQANSSQTKALQDIEALEREWMKFAREMLQKGADIKTVSGKENVHLARDVIDAIRKGFETFVAEEERLRNELHRTVNSSARHTVQISLAFAFVIGVFIAFGARHSMRTIANEYEKILGDLEVARSALQKSHDSLETKVEERTVALRSANAEIEAFSYAVSHDLRAPLRGIDGFSLALAEDYGDRLDEEGKRYLRFVREGVQRMGKLIDDMLALSRLSRVEMRRERVDLAALAREGVNRLKQEDPQRKVRLDTHGDLVAVGDAGLLAVVIENLLSNAWKFSSKKSETVLELNASPSPDHPDVTVYSLKDHGAGFDMAFGDKLFGAFQRLHTVHEFEGTGIGLATVRRIVRRHGGRIWAEGKVGEGATFSFTLGQGSEAEA